MKKLTNYNRYIFNSKAQQPTFEKSTACCAEFKHVLLGG